MIGCPSIMPVVVCGVVGGANDVCTISFAESCGVKIAVLVLGVLNKGCRRNRRMVRAVRGEVSFTTLLVTTSSVCSNRRMVRAVRGDASRMVRVVGEFF